MLVTFKEQKMLPARNGTAYNKYIQKIFNLIIVNRIFLGDSLRFIVNPLLLIYFFLLENCYNCEKIDNYFSIIKTKK